MGDPELFSVCCKQTYGGATARLTIASGSPGIGVAGTLAARAGELVGRTEDWLHKVENDRIQLDRLSVLNSPATGTSTAARR